MNDKADIKKDIEKYIKDFKKGNLTDKAINFFKCMGYNTELQAPLSKTLYSEFEENYIKNNPNEINFKQDKAIVNEWIYVDFLFQITKYQILEQISLFDTKKVDNKIIESYLFFIIELRENEYSRTKLSNITREINKLFLMPVMILFKHGNCLSLSIINRRLHKKDENKDVLEKVTLIKDININKPHRGQIEILFDLSFNELYRKYSFKNFVELHNAWQKTLDSSELNKKFYKEIADWYFWAVDKVEFPDDEIENRETRNSINTIRLLTRIIFVWFLKEKNLIPEDIFDVDKLDEILNSLDENQTTYYKAILQNLFFATLNQEMNTDEKPENRKFRNDRQHYNITNLYRYEKYFKNKEIFLDLMSGIPFLNGGLFECLDKPDKDNTKKILRVDGFSDRDDNKLSIPNYLFFSVESTADLRKIYDNPKKKDEKVRGLIEILKSYKFTVHENTPIEEEVALDPELLGKVFENLLASFNPETKTTARNQTGSFYTPREIVDYMVNESLIAYFSNSMNEYTEYKNNTSAKSSQINIFGKEEPQQLMFNSHIKPLSNKDTNDINIRLRHLLSYTDDPHKFNSDEVFLLIKAIDNSKIIDPACGSGAFPMGILHKMVYILTKLDPNNERWKQKQIDKIKEITDPNIREKYLSDIEESFKINNELDYGRKLYLIENCIFGVDIQPIAVQISKLRFFISLVIDQGIDKSKENLGIRPLPNLETKFVSADSLITVEKPKVMMLSLNMQKIDDLEHKLKRVRDQHFAARTQKTKKKYREEDERLRGEIASLLKEDGFSNEATKRLANWNPYDQNGKADFFDPEWMFGIKDGFDIVIGNPPYIQIQSFDSKKKEIWREQCYKTFEATGDIYCLFYEKGVNLLKKDGVLCYITSNKWLRAEYGRSMREFFLKNTNPKILINFNQNLIFENVIVHSNILTLTKTANNNSLESCTIKDDYNLKLPLDDYFNKSKVVLDDLTSDIWNLLSKEEYLIKKRIEKVGKPLKKWNILINYGIKTGFNEAFIIDGAKKDELIKADSKNSEIIKPILRGRDVRKYHINFKDLWLINTHNGLKDENIKPINVLNDYPKIYEHLKKYQDQLTKRHDKGLDWTNLRNCAYLRELEYEKIIFSEIVSEPQFHLDKQGYYPEATTFFISGEKLKYLISLLNSKPVTYFFTKFYAGGELVGKYRYKKSYLENLPIPDIESDKTTPFEIMVDCITFAKEKELTIEAETLESVVDGMVYDLYFEEDMKKNECYIIDRISEKVKPFKDDDTNDFKSEYIKALYNFCLKDKTIYRSLIYRKNIEVVKVIEVL